MDIICYYSILCISFYYVLFRESVVIFRSELICLLEYFRSNESNNLAYTNANQGKFQETSIFPDGVHGISNTRVCTPYKKVEYGIQKFQNIVKKYNYVNERNSLIEKLKKLLESTIKYRFIYFIKFH